MKEENKSLHPEGKICLLNGSVIDGYAKDTQPVSSQSDDIRKEEQSSENEKLFTDNAFFLLGQAERIFEDSRMFLAPVNVKNGLAYSGTSGFQSPTLGVYLEWWLFGNNSLLAISNEDLLLCQMSGSPLSGRNSCKLVNSNGDLVYKEIPHFRSAWASFVKINSRYESPKQQYSAFSLEETIEILKKEANPMAEMRSEIAFLKAKINALTVSLEEQTKRADSLQDKLQEIAVKMNREALQEFVDTYISMKNEADEQIKQINAERQELKVRLGNGELQDKEYKKQMQILAGKKREIKSSLSLFYYNKLAELLPGKYLTFEQICKYLQN